MTKIQASGLRTPRAATKIQRLAPTRSMTWKKLAAMISDGYGQGHQEHYKPWLQITKRTSSPVSNIGLLPAPDLGRTHHYLAKDEKTTILLLKWLGALDVREQYPVWPWPHLHPLHGLQHPDAEQRLPGLERIADDLGIEHGRFFGTEIPYVATLDILSTWTGNDGRPRLIAHECKPESMITGPDSKRINERLKLTERYCAHAHIPRFIFHAEHLPDNLPVNLDALDPRLPRHRISEIKETRRYQSLIEAIDRDRASKAPAETLKGLCRQTGMPSAEARNMLHLAIWSQDVDHDLTQPLELHLPLISGGRQLKRRLESLMLGGLT